MLVVVVVRLEEPVSGQVVMQILTKGENNHIHRTFLDSVTFEINRYERRTWTVVRQVVKVVNARVMIRSEGTPMVL